LSQIIVYKLDENGEEVWQYPASLLDRQPSAVRLEAYFNRDDLDLGFVVFKRGDQFIETFYSDRWYNIFAVYDRDDRQLKGWYCNICRPADLGDKVIRCEDLALDIWSSPEGEIEILDEAEFVSLPIGAEERNNCLLALQELQRLAQSRQLPR
jgi:hypothetical protein